MRENSASVDSSEPTGAAVRPDSVITSVSRGLLGAGESVQEGGEQDTVCPGETRFAGLPLQDGELVAQGEDFDALVGVTHRQQPHQREHAR